MIPKDAVIVPWAHCCNRPQGSCTCDPDAVYVMHGTKAFPPGQELADVLIADFIKRGPALSEEESRQRDIEKAELIGPPVLSIPIRYRLEMQCNIAQVDVERLAKHWEGHPLIEAMSNREAFNARIFTDAAEHIRKLEHALQRIAGMTKLTGIDNAPDIARKALEE